LPGQSNTHTVRANHQAQIGLEVSSGARYASESSGKTGIPHPATNLRDGVGLHSPIGRGVVGARKVKRGFVRKGGGRGAWFQHLATALHGLRQYIPRKSLMGKWGGTHKDEPAGLPRVSARTPKELLSTLFSGELPGRSREG